MRIKRLATMFLMSVMAVSCFSALSHAEEPEYIIKLSHDGAGAGAQFDGQTFFKERLEELTDGRVRVDIYPGSALGDKAASMEGLQLGTIEAAEISIINMTSYDDRWEVFALPYFFRDADQACAICRDPAIHEILEQNAEDNGFMILGYVSVGERDIYSRKQINTVDDMKGLKIRVLGSNGLVKCMEDMGASPLSLTWSDCYSALQQGTIDAVENSTEVLYSNGFPDLPGYYTATAHFVLPDMIIFSKAVYDVLPEDIQEAVIQAGLDMEAEWNNTIYKEATEKAIAAMEEKGVEIIHPDPTSFQESAAKTRETLTGSYNDNQKALYEAISSVMENY